MIIINKKKLTKIITTLSKLWEELESYQADNEENLTSDEGENINTAMDCIEQAEYALKRLFPRG